MMPQVAEQLEPPARQNAAEPVPALERQMPLLDLCSALGPVPRIDEPGCHRLDALLHMDLDLGRHSDPLRRRTSAKKSAIRRSTDTAYTTTRPLSSISENSATRPRLARIWPSSSRRFTRRSGSVTLTS